MLARFSVPYAARDIRHHDHYMPDAAILGTHCVQVSLGGERRAVATMQACNPVHFTTICVGIQPKQ
jgi:hypothetical protein